MDFRPTIQARMAELGLTPHALARLCGWTPQNRGKPTPTTIRRYLAGQDIRASGLAKVCHALGLELGIRSPTVVDSQSDERVG